MYSFFCAISLALAFPLVSGEDMPSYLNITALEGEPCSVKLDKLAKENCSKQKKFIVGAASVDWYQAKINCEKFGFKLATITCKEENDEVMKQLKIQGTTAPEAWIGLNDLAKEGRYTWCSDVKLNASAYLNWYVGEPNDAYNFEDCVHLYPDGSFNDFSCYTNLLYVCEYHIGCC